LRAVASLNETEGGCLDRYCALLHEALGERLIEIRLRLR
jgi:hypothetical protein